MATDPRQVLMQLKAQCLALVALEQSFQQSPTSQTGQAIDFANSEKERLESIEENIARWERCRPAVMLGLEQPLWEVQSLMKTALELHNSNQTRMERLGERVKLTLGETRKTLQLLRMNQEAQVGRHLDMLG